MTLLGQFCVPESRHSQWALWLACVTVAACSTPASAEMGRAHATEQQPEKSLPVSSLVAEPAPQLANVPQVGEGERAVAAGGGPSASSGEPLAPPTPDLHIALEGDRDQLQINLPPEANAGPHRLTYWLTGDEDVTLEVEVGSGSRAEPTRLIGTLLIDGKQHKFSLDGGHAELWLSRSVQPHSVEAFSLRVPGRSIPGGMHSAALLFWYENGKEFPGIGLTLRKAGPSSAALSFSSPTRVLTGTGQRRLEVHTVGGSLPLLGTLSPTARPRPNGDLSLVAHAEGLGARGLDGHVAFAAFLDGKQLPLQPFAPVPHLRVGEKAACELDVTLHALPVASGHSLVFYVLEGFGEPAELPSGEPNPALRPPRQIGRLRW